MMTDKGDTLTDDLPQEPGWTAPAQTPGPTLVQAE